ncbi:MAG: ATPase, T2SS/T4P/T4SS family, partial [bacterium]
MSMKFGEILVRFDKTTEACISDALKKQEEVEKDKKIGNILVDNGDIIPMDIVEALCEQTGLSAIDEEHIEKQDYSVLKDFPINLARKYRAIPLYEENDELYVATAEPQNTFLYNQMFMIYEKTVVPVLMEENKLTDLINIAYSRMDTGEGQLNADELKDMVDEDDTGIPDLIDSEDEAPIIRFVNNIISRAVKQGVSDIHFESFEDEMYVRFRKDGKLHLIQQVPKAAQSGLITRIKIMSKMNISEKRLPQDGNIKVRIAGNDIDFRVSTIPSMHGESVVLRVLDKTTQKLSLEEVGFSQRDLKQMRRIIQDKHGIFL